MAPEPVFPSQFREALRDLARLPTHDADRVITAVREVAPLQRVADILDAAASASPPEFAGASRQVVGALISLQREARGHGPAEVAEIILGVPGLQVEGENRHRLAERVEALSKASSIRTTAAAVDLLTQHDRNYGAARIFTDIRPLFDEDVSRAPSAAVIVEMLQLETWGPNGQSESIHVAMDESDLVELQGVIDRALKKSSAVRQMLGEQGVATFTMDERRS